MPPSAADVHPRPAAIETLRGVAASVSGVRLASVDACILRGSMHYLLRHTPAAPLYACPHAFIAASMCLQELGRAEVLQQQACFLPTSSDGVPVIGRIPGLNNAYIATAHSCWGILNAPATGEALAELVVDGKASSSDLRPFDPARFALRRR